MGVETVEYRVRRGDTLQNIVEAAGFPRRDWQRIYNAPYNRALKARRPDPDHIEAGDIVMLPRYTPAEVAEMGRRLQVAERRLQDLRRANAQFERRITELERALSDVRASSERDLQRNVAVLMKEADNLHSIANSAGEECDDAYSCMGAGAVVAKFEIRARNLRASARAMKREITRGESVAAKALKTLRASRRDLQREEAAGAKNLTRLVNQHKSAAQRPY